MKHTMKKLSALLLALVMVLALATVTTQAWDSEEHEHELTFVANGNTITATCTAESIPMEKEECDLKNKPATLTISTPTNLIYDGNAKEAVATTTDTSVFNQVYTVTYKQGEETLNSAPVKAGKYTASVSHSVTTYYPETKTTVYTASVEFEIVDPVKDLTVTSPLGAITRVTVDGKDVDSKDYTAQGGTVVLSKDFIRNLAAGAHTIRVYQGSSYSTASYTAGENAATVVAATGITSPVSGNADAVKTTSPKTADPGLALYGVLAISSTLGLAFVGKRKEH